jgi:phosphatidylglycerol---prolipoprotein diacylglyceryl transferase
MVASHRVLYYNQWTDLTDQRRNDLTIDQIGIHFGAFTLHFYGLILMSGVIAAAFLTAWRARQTGRDPETIWDMVTWLVIAGVLGARIWHILTPPASMVEYGITTQFYLTHPLDAIAIWKGGLGIPGAVIGGALGLFIYTRRKEISFLVWADLIAPGLALAQAIGRMGNFVNQELYGKPLNPDIPWALFIEPAYRITPYLEVTHYHPLFLYELLWNLGNAAVLIWIGKRFAERLKAGDVFLAYLFIYPVGRFFLEFLRLDPSPVGGININQTLMAVVALSAAATLYWKHRNDTPPVPVSSDESTDTLSSD